MHVGAAHWLHGGRDQRVRAGAHRWPLPARAVAGGEQVVRRRNADARAFSFSSAHRSLVHVRSEVSVDARVDVVLAGAAEPAGTHQSADAARERVQRAGARPQHGPRAPVQPGHGGPAARAVHRVLGRARDRAALAHRPPQAPRPVRAPQRRRLLHRVRLPARAPGRPAARQ